MGDDHSAADAFGLLSDATRIDILLAVAEGHAESSGIGSTFGELAFSEIYDRVDVDNTSKLSYHLGELAGIFLRKTDGGYSLTHAGERIVRFVLSRNYGSPPDFGPEETAGTCPLCGGTAIEASFFNQFFLVECTSCERPVGGFPVTPAQARSWEGRDLVRSVKRNLAADYAKIQCGICPECAGRLSTEVREPPESPLSDTDPFIAVDECEECQRGYNAPLAYEVAYHPASVAFHWERGVDVTTMGMWEFHEHAYEGRWTSRRTSTDPDEYEVEMRHGDDALRLVVDSSARVTRTERVRRDSVADRRS